MKRSGTIGIVVGLLIVAAAGALAAGFVPTFGFGGIPSPSQAVEEWLRAAQRGDVDDMIDRSAPDRRAEFERHRQHIRRLAHAPASDRVGTSGGGAAFDFDMLDTSLGRGQAVATVRVRLTRHETTVTRDYQVVWIDGRWLVEGWRDADVSGNGWSPGRGSVP